MLRRLRHKLAMIRYYSAPRRETRWSRAMDIAFFAAFFLCLPATWIANLTVARPQSAFDLSGWIADRSDLNPATTDAWLANSPRAKAISANIKITGNFRLMIDDHYCGWPLTTSIHRQPAVLDIDILATAAAQKNVHLAADSPLRQAIDTALAEDDQNEALMAWRNETGSVRQHWLNWAIAAGIWWILLTFASSLVINLARLGWLQVERNRSRRKAHWQGQGKCSSCGYDLTGLEFNERCPECGQLVA